MMLAWGQEAHARNMTKASEKYIFEANRCVVDFTLDKRNNNRVAFWRYGSVRPVFFFIFDHSEK